MSGLYNMVMGRNPALPYLLAILGITEETCEQWPLGRLRDAWINADATRIGVLHRNGDTVEEALTKHPNYLGKHSCIGDTTYGWYEFSVPEDFRGENGVATKIAAATDNTNCFDRYMQAIKDLQEGRQNPQTEHMLQVGKQLIDGLSQSMADGQSRTIKSGDGSVDIISPQPGEPHGSRPEGGTHESVS